MHLPSTFRPSVLQPHSEPQYYNPLPVDPVIHASMKGRSVGACRSLAPLPAEALSYGHASPPPPPPPAPPATPPLFRGRGARVPQRREPLRGGGGGAAGEPGASRSSPADHPPPRSGSGRLPAAHGPRRADTYRPRRYHLGRSPGRRRGPGPTDRK